MTIANPPLTIEAFDAYQTQHPDRLLELIDGRIIEKVTGLEHGRIVLRIGARLLAWYESQPDINGNYGTEVTHRKPDDPRNSFLPDVSFSYATDDSPSTGTVMGMPDFAVEVKSPSNSYQELRDKARYYLQNGTKLVWLVYPAKQIVEVYFADGTSELFLGDEVLEGGDVLPDFTISISDIFAS